jgi:prepilin-type N-terminal cleavage/methylation domain-containing protein
MMRARRGYTLWELTMVLLVLAIAATLAVPAFSDFGRDPEPTGADAMLGLLKDARKAAIDFNANVTLRLDPETLRYELDTSSVSGYGVLAAGTLDLGLAHTLVTDQPRLQYVFRPTGAAFGDTVVVRGGARPLTIRLDPWSGVAHADSL